MSDEALRVLGKIWHIACYLGDHPSSQRSLLIRLIEKLTGGWRPIALFRSTFRVFSATHSREVKDWLRTTSAVRPWINTTQGREIGDATWRVQARLAIRATRYSAVEISLDKAKAFDHVDRTDLITIGGQLGYPLCTLVLSLNSYRWPRRIVWEK